MKNLSHFPVTKAPHRLLATVLLLTLIVPTLRADFPAELLRERRIQTDVGVSELEGLHLAIDGTTLVQSDFVSSLSVVRAFVLEGTNWVPQAIFQPEDPEEVFGFGESIAIDGDTVVIGSPFEASAPPFQGSAYVFVRNGTNWMRQARVESADEFFGSEVDIDGDTMVVGAAAAGTATVFVRVGTNWIQQTRRVTGTRDREGAVALDGDTLVVGDWTRNVFGAAYVFVRAGTNWTQQARLTATDTGTPNMSRRHVAISGDTIAVGDLHGSIGRIYVFQRSGTNWTRQAKLTTTDTPAATAFGRYVALDGDVFVASADTDNSAGTFSGAAYLFERTGTNWTQRAKLTASDAAPNRQFGKYVALSGKRVAAANADVGVYVFAPDYMGVRKYLYSPDAVAAGFNPDETAFRYRHLLYGRDTNNLLRARFETMAALYGTAERDRSFVAQTRLLEGLADEPDNPVLGNLLLDIYYDRSAAQAIFASEVLAKAKVARFGPTIAPGPPGSGFLIDNEIPLHEQALATNRFALREYFDLLQLELVTGAGLDAQFGYRLFQSLVPTRALMAATYINGGVNVTVGTNAMLFEGFKDLVLLFDQLSRYGNDTAEFGRLLFARGNPGDLDRAKQAAGEAQQFVFLQGNLLKNTFTNLPPEDDPSGLVQAIRSWNRSLTSLTELQQALNGRANPLGFDPDFLMLSERISNGGTTFFDSFDAFARRLDPGSSLSPVAIALGDFQRAQNNYNLYRGYQDQLHDQLGQATGSYEDRLFQIVGAYPGASAYSDNPTNNRGSELDQQYRSIELAQLRIRRNAAEINNLYAQVQIEINRAGAISNAAIDFGNKRAALAEKLAHINAVQSGANALAESLTVEKLTTGLFVGFLVNAGVQAGAEELKGQVEQEKERLAGLEQATIEGINSAATVKTLMLQMNTLALDSQEAAILLQQEMARLVALFREKQALEARIEEANAELSNRYYADPIHRITAETNLITSNFSFEDAQKWVFFLTRAFHYKWNTPFVNNGYLGRNWNTNSVFKVRNAAELRDLYLALVNKDSTIGLGLNRDDFLSSFSVRKDFFGFEDGGTYTDPTTLETVSAIEAFRRQLRRTMVTNLSDVRLEIDFSTVREKLSTSFFLGPRFGLNGQPISPGRYLDKIVWLKIKIPGNHTTGFTQANGDLNYGGTSFIRRQNVGSFDPARPDRVRNEMTAFSTRFWFFDTDLDRFRFNDGFLSSGVQIELSPNPEVPPSVQQINDFIERSVAASNWHLSIPIRQRQNPNDIDIARISEMDDILIYFSHQSVSRQLP